MQRKSFLVDAHCHIDLYPDPAKFLDESERENIYTIAVTNAPFVFRHTADLAANSRYTRAAIGLHPELVATYGEQVDKLLPLLKETRYVGEIGLDYITSDMALRRKQRKVLETILGWCAEQKNKILTLHSRRAVSDVINIVGNNYPGKVILHWFTGTSKEVEFASNYGMYFSVNSSMVSSEKGLSLISKMPVERILTESDGPFVRVYDKNTQSLIIRRAVEGLSLNWSVSFEEAKSTVFNNFYSILAGDKTKTSAS